MLQEKLFVFAFFFVVTLAALVAGDWSARLIDRTDNPDTPMVFVMTIVSGIIVFIALTAAMSALGVFRAEGQESGGD